LRSVPPSAGSAPGPIPAKNLADSVIHAVAVHDQQVRSSRWRLVVVLLSVLYAVDGGEIGAVRLALARAVG